MMLSGGYRSPYYYDIDAQKDKILKFTTPDVSLFLLSPRQAATPCFLHLLIAYDMSLLLINVFKDLSISTRKKK